MKRTGRASIKLKFTNLLSATIFFLISAGCALVLILFSRATQKEILDRLQQLHADYYEEEILLQQEEIISHVETIATLLSGNRGTPQEMDSLITSVSSKYESFRYRLLDHALMPLRSGPPAESDPLVFPADAGKNTQTISWYGGNGQTGLFLYALSPIPAEWTTPAIYVLVSTPLGRQESIMRLHNAYGVDASVFAGDVRISTTLLDKAGYAVGTKLNKKVSAGLLKTATTYVGESDILGEPYQTMYRSFGNPGEAPLGIIGIGESLRKFHGTLLNMTLLVTLLGLFLMAVSIVLSRYWLQRNIVHPLQRTSSTLASAVQGGTDFEARLNANTQYEEFSQLNRSIIKMVRELSDSRQQLEQYAYCDDLTGLPNRHSLFKRHGGSLQPAGSLLYVVCMDLDNLKMVNNVAGHLVGDHLLQHVSFLLTGILDNFPHQEAYRIGGDEFVVCLMAESNAEIGTGFGTEDRPGAGSNDGSGAGSDSGADIGANVLDRFVDILREKLLQPFRYEEHAMDITVSIGVASGESGLAPISTLLQNAEEALYEAKRRRGQRYVLFSPEMGESRRIRKELGMDLKHSVERNELFLTYQPKMDFSTERCTSCEALIRWNHPTKGLVSPIDFIDVAEETGFIIPMGRWVLEEACAALARLHSRFGSTIRMSVNISILQLNREDFVRLVLETLLKSRLQPEHIELEITESVLIDSLGTALDKLQQLHVLGVGVSIDDFGKGYSSLAYLRSLPISTLKIDKQFVDEIGDDQDILLGDIIKMGRHLNLRTVAEGVETLEQREFLREMDCDAIQGYYYSRPLREDDLFRFIAHETEQGQVG